MFTVSQFVELPVTASIPVTSRLTVAPGSKSATSGDVIERQRRRIRAVARGCGHGDDRVRHLGLEVARRGRDMRHRRDRRTPGIRDLDDDTVAVGARLEVVADSPVAPDPNFDARDSSPVPSQAAGARRHRASRGRAGSCQERPVWPLRARSVEFLPPPCAPRRSSRVSHPRRSARVRPAAASRDRSRASWCRSSQHCSSGRPRPRSSGRPSPGRSVAMSPRTRRRPGCRHRPT